MESLSHLQLAAMQILCKNHVQRLEEVAGEVVLVGHLAEAEALVDQQQHHQVCFHCKQSFGCKLHYLDGTFTSGMW